MFPFPKGKCSLHILMKAKVLCIECGQQNAVNNTTFSTPLCFVVNATTIHPLIKYRHLTVALYSFDLKMKWFCCFLLDLFYIFQMIDPALIPKVTSKSRCVDSADVQFSCMSFSHGFKLFTPSLSLRGLNMATATIWTSGNLMVAYLPSWTKSPHHSALE